MMLYIDPGTGSMLFTVIIGAFGAVVYLFRSIFIKFKMSIGRDKSVKINENKLPIVIFSDHKRYWNVFEPICKELEERQQSAVYYTASPDDPALNESYKYVKCEFIGSGNKAFSRLNLLNAYVVLATTPSLDVFQWKRSKMTDFYVHILHMVSDATLYRMFGLDYYDAVLLSGDFQEEQLKKLWDGRNIIPKEYRIVGNPYMDEMLKRVKKERKVKSSEERKKVLLAPTWGPNGIFTRFGGEIIEELLKTDFDITIRPHPQSFTAEKEMINELITKYPDSDRLRWNTDNDNFDCLNDADIMISDYSGVIFDFALIFDKPVIYTDTDINLDVYDAHFVNDKLWTLEILPQIGMNLVPENLDKIGDLITKCLNSDDFKTGRDKARQESWMHQGESAKLTVDYIIDKYNELSQGNT